jgi:hypothetical protein
MSKSANASRATDTKSKARAKTQKTPESRRRELRYSVGTRSREIIGVLLIALALLSLLALSNLTRGSLSDCGVIYSTGCSGGRVCLYNHGARSEC